MQETVDMASLASNLSRPGPWSPHPKFDGVSMLLLVGGSASGGALSQHLVRVAPGAALATHVHPYQAESHVVLAGGGQADIGDVSFVYSPGTVTAIPAGISHSVWAGETGLMLLATFSPPLA